MRSNTCEPASVRDTAIVLILLVAIGICAACGHFFYNQTETVSAAYPQIHAGQVITHFPRTA